jgi:hypothetical protein
MTCLSLFQVQIDHMAKSLACTFHSQVVETIQGSPQHHHVFSCHCCKFLFVINYKKNGVL